MPTRLGSFAALMVFLAPVPAQADPVEHGALRLEWSAPGGCPNGIEVLERIETLLGARVADLRAEPISAKGKVTQIEPLRFALELETHQRDQRFVRSMQAPSCAELSDAGALVLALAIDPTLAERQARAADEQVPETSAFSSEPPPLPPAKPAPPTPKPAGPVQSLDSTFQRDEPPEVEPKRSGPAPEWSARAGLVADVGSVASVAFGPRAAVAAGWGALRVELGFLWLPPARTITAENPERGGDIDLVAGDLAGCFLPARGDFEVEGCVGFELGRVHGAGFGTVEQGEGSALWFGGGVVGITRYWVTHSIALAATAGLLVVPQHTEFTLENVGVVHDVPWAVGRFGVAVETEFE
jgi:hypothetical protein